MKQVRRWLHPENGVEAVMNKIVVKQLLIGLPNDLKGFVASHNPETPTVVANLIETYDSAHANWAYQQIRTWYQEQPDHKRSNHSRKESGGPRK
uniref:SCAN box domain-containing protein n=1 Tax=Amphimedon queenslandica TaxID=400682 RepID=A0A1X7UC95_AMPQE